MLEPIEPVAPRRLTDRFSYGYSHGGVGLIGLILIVVLVLVLMGRF